MKTTGIVLILAIITAGACAAGIDAPQPVPGTLVVAVDTSGSVKASFDECIGLIGRLIHAAPDGSSVRLIRFDETANIVAHADTVSAGAKGALLKRAESLKATGQLTDFGAAVRSMDAAVRASPGPHLLVVFTDCLSDTRSKVVEPLDRLLLATFPPERETTLYIVVPDQHALALVDPDPRLHTATFSNFVPGEVVARALPVRFVAQHWQWFVPSFVLWATAYLLCACILALLLGRARRWLRRRPRDPRRTGSTPLGESTSFHLLAAHNGQEMDFGPLQSLRRVAVGSAPGCDFRVITANGKSSKVLLKQDRRERFSLQNQGATVTLVNGLPLPPRKKVSTRLPVRIDLGDEHEVRLSLVTPTENNNEGSVM